MLFRSERQQEWKKVGESLSATVAVEMGKLEAALAELDVKKELAGAIEAELGKKRQVQKEATEKRMALIQIETKDFSCHSC